MKRLTIFALLFTLLAAAQTAPKPRKAPPFAWPADAVEITAEPQFRPALENEGVRVFRLELPPRGSTELIQHQHDYLLLALAGARLEIAPQKGSPQRIAMRPGELQMGSKGHVDRLANAGDAPLQLQLIEIPAGLAAQEAICGLNSGRMCDADLGDLQGPRYSVSGIFETSTVKVGQTEIDPEAVIAEHTHKYPHLVIALSDLDLRSEAADKQPAEVHMQAGELAWIPGGVTHRLTSVGKTIAKFLTIEVKD